MAQVQAPVPIRPEGCREPTSLAPTGRDLPPVRFVGPPRGSADRRSLDRWCEGVGQVIVDERPDPRANALDPRVDRIWIVSWNVKSGEGDVVRLVQDVRDRIVAEGGNPDHLILLLQEAYSRRTGALGEASAGRETALWPNRRIGNDRARPTTSDVVDVADALGMSLVYSPSMLNGSPGGGVPEDRGNAVLSGLRPDSATIVELPFEAQRRAVVAGHWSGHTPAGSPWNVTLASVHLDLHARGWRALGLLRTSGRTRQAQGIVDALAGPTPMVVTGDFNTTLSRTEPALRILKEAFPRPARHQSRPTFVAGPFGMLDFQLDYMFFDVPDEWRVHYERLDHEYGSDHYPLLGWMDFSGS